MTWSSVDNPTPARIGKPNAPASTMASAQGRATRGPSRASEPSGAPDATAVPEGHLRRKRSVDAGDDIDDRVSVDRAVSGLHAEAEPRIAREVPRPAGADAALEPERRVDPHAPLLHEVGPAIVIGRRDPEVRERLEDALGRGPREHARRLARDVALRKVRTVAHRRRHAVIVSMPLPPAASVAPRKPAPYTGTLGERIFGAVQCVRPGIRGSCSVCCALESHSRGPGFESPQLHSMNLSDPDRQANIAFALIVLGIVFVRALTIWLFYGAQLYA